MRADRCKACNQPTTDPIGLCPACSRSLSGSAPAAPPKPFTGRQLAEAVLLFWQGKTWTEADQARWNEITRSSEDTMEARSAVLCSMASSVLGGGR